MTLGSAWKLASILPLVFACAPKGLGRPNPDFLVVAHRGAPTVTAENTIRSFDVAKALGANAIETDVCITRDGQLILWHDRDPDDIVAGVRQLGQEGLLYSPHVPPVGSPFRKPVEQIDWADFQMHYGYNDLEGRIDPTAPIPTFEEFLAWTSEPAVGNVDIDAVYVDIKLTEAQVGAAEQIVSRIADAVEMFPALAGKRFFLLTPRPALAGVLDAAQAESGVSVMRTVVDYEKPGALRGTLGAGLRDVSTGITPAVTWSAFRSEVADIVDARERGEIDSVTVWTFDDPGRLAELLYYSVDGIMTNDVALLHRMWFDTTH